MTFVSGLMSEAVRLVQQEEMLRAKLAHLAATIPSIEPSVAEVLRSADDAEGSHKIDRLAEGYERICAGAEFHAGRWTDPRFDSRGAEDVRAVLERLAREAKAGAVTMNEIADLLNMWKAKAGTVAAASPAPNRRERRKRAAIARRRF
jgi:beta-phosphoglucomutase-like phosphatase (HAD superfamily)